MTMPLTSPSNWSTKQIQAFTSADIKLLTPKQIAQLSPVQVNALSSSQLKAFSAAQISAISNQSVIFANGFIQSSAMKIGQGDATAISSAGQIDGRLAGGWLGSPTGNPAAAHGLKRIPNGVEFWLQALDGHYTKAVQIRLTNDGKGNIVAQIIQAAYVDGAYPDYDFATQPHSSAPIATLQTSDGYGVAMLRIALQPGLTSQQLLILGPTQMAGLSTTQVETLTATQVASWSAVQFAALSDSALAAFSALQMSKVTASELSKLTQHQFQQLSPSAISGIPSSTIGKLANANLGWLTLPQIASLSPAQINALSSSQLKAFSATQIGAISNQSISFANGFMQSGATIIGQGDATTLNGALQIEGTLAGGWFGSPTGNPASAHGLKHIANGVEFWLQTLDAHYTKAVQIRLTNDGKGNIVAQIIQAAYVDGAYPDYDFATQPHSSAPIATLQGGDGYGVAMLHVALQPGLSSQQLLKLSAAQIAGLTSTQIETLSATQIAGLDAQHFAALSDHALGSLTALQMSKVTAKGLSRLTQHQFEQLTPNAFSGLQSATLSDLTTEQIDWLYQQQPKGASVIPRSDKLPLYYQNWISSTPSERKNGGLFSYLQTNTPIGPYTLPPNYKRDNIEGAYALQLFFDKNPNAPEFSTALAEALGIVRFDFFLMQDNATGYLTRSSLLAAASNENFSSMIRQAAALLATPAFFQLLDVGAENRYFDKPDGAISRKDIDQFFERNLIPCDIEQITSLIKAGAIYNLADTTLTSSTFPGTNTIQATASSLVSLTNQLTQLRSAYSEGNFWFRYNDGNSNKDIDATVANLSDQIQKKMSSLVTSATDANLPWTATVTKSTTNLFHAAEIEHMEKCLCALAIKYADTTFKSITAELGKPSHAYGAILAKYIDTASQLLTAGEYQLSPMQLLSYSGVPNIQDTLANEYINNIVSGKLLKDILDQGKPLDQAIELFLQNATALASALDSSIVTPDRLSTLKQNMSDIMFDALINQNASAIQDALILPDGSVNMELLKFILDQVDSTTIGGSPINVSDMGKVFKTLFGRLQSGQKLTDALNKLNLTGFSPNAGYAAGLYHAVSGLLGVLAMINVKKGGSQVATAGSAISVIGSLMESGSRGAKFFDREENVFLAAAGKGVSATGTAIASALSIMSAIAAFAQGNNAAGGLSAAQASLSLLQAATATGEGLTTVIPRMAQLLGKQIGASILEGLTTANAVFSLIGSVAGIMGAGVSWATMIASMVSDFQHWGRQSDFIDSFYPTADAYGISYDSMASYREVHQKDYMNSIAGQLIFFDGITALTGSGGGTIYLDDTYKGNPTITFAFKGNNVVRAETGKTANRSVTIDNARSVNYWSGSQSDGDNIIQLGDGNNRITLGDGINSIQLGKGSNAVSLGNGVNTLTVGNGDNNISLGNGIDVVKFGEGHNTIKVGTGGNTLFYTGKMAGTQLTSITAGGNSKLSFSLSQTNGTYGAYAKTDSKGAGSVSYSNGREGWNINFSGIKTIIGTANADTFLLGGGQSGMTWAGNDGADRYIVNRGAGLNYIDDHDSTPGTLDSLEFVDAQQTNLWLSHVDNDLQIKVMGSADQIVIKNWYSAGQTASASQIERIKTADGLTMYNSDVEKLVQAMATFAPPSSSATSWSDVQSNQGQILLTITH